MNDHQTFSWKHILLCAEFPLLQARCACAPNADNWYFEHSEKGVLTNTAIFTGMLRRCWFLFLWRPAYLSLNAAKLGYEALEKSDMPVISGEKRFRLYANRCQP